MKKIILSLSFAALFIFLGNTAFSQNWKAGIKKISEADGLVTYQIQLKSVSSASEAERLDNALMNKVPILSAETSTETKVCTLVTKPRYKAPDIVRVVDFAGFEVAKKFNQ